jgi:hypothetical protein
MTYTLISSTTIGAGGAANIDLTSIPQTYTDLLLLVSIRGNGGASYRNVPLRVNNDATLLWQQRLLGGDGSTASSASYSATNGSDMVWGLVADSIPTANAFTSVQYYFSNYASTTINKAVSFEGVAENNASTASLRIASAVWYSNNAISRITLTPETGSWIQYTTATLYGIN